MRNQSRPDSPALPLSKYSMSSAPPVICRFSSLPDAPERRQAARRRSNRSARPRSSCRASTRRSGRSSLSTRSGTAAPAGHGVRREAFELLDRAGLSPPGQVEDRLLVFHRRHLQCDSVRLWAPYRRCRSQDRERGAPCGSPPIRPRCVPFGGSFEGDGRPTLTSTVWPAERLCACEYLPVKVRGC